MAGLHSSSFDGALMEVGPVRLNTPEKPGDRPTLREIQGAWNEYANVLFRARIALRPFMA
jgi:carboxypeptidase D